MINLFAFAAANELVARVFERCEACGLCPNITDPDVQEHMAIVIENGQIDRKVLSPSDLSYDNVAHDLIHAYFQAVRYLNEVRAFIETLPKSDDGTQEKILARLSQIERAIECLAPPRRHPNSQTKSQLIYTVQHGLGGVCPCCEKTEIVRAGQKLDAAEFDHALSRHQNRAHEMWLICRPCNQGLPNARPLRANTMEKFHRFQRLRFQFFDQPQGKLFN